MHRPVASQALMLLAGCTLISSCSALDARERYLRTADVSGEVVETALSDNELADLDAPVIHRFKSVPTLVYVAGVPTDSRATPIKRARGLQETLAKMHKYTINVAPSNPRTAELRGDAEVTPFEDAGFDLAHKTLRSLNVALQPVQVALIDSGVVPATTSIRSFLARTTNLTEQTSQCDWYEHGTAIASVLAGVILPDRVGSPCAESAEARAQGATEGNFLVRYAENIKLHSIKISFENDPIETMRQDLGSLQLAAALDEAVAGGAQIVNLSFSYADREPSLTVQATEKRIISAAAARGVIFVVAAGNAARNLDLAPANPASYDLDNVVAVGSHTPTHERSISSNFGSTVDLTALGSQVWANTPGGAIKLFSGTSFAAPLVTSALALYRGICPATSHRTLLRHLFQTANYDYRNRQTNPEPMEDHSGEPSNSENQAGGSTERISRFGRLDANAFVQEGDTEKCE